MPRVRTKMIPVQILLAALVLATGTGASTDTYDSWGTQKSDVLATMASGTKFREFAPSDEPSYQNIIMNYILTINKDLSGGITVVRVSSRPEKDLLFINGRLYSITENFGTVSREALEGLVRDLSAGYGEPVLQSDPSLTTYTFTTSATKVIVYSYPGGRSTSCKVYYYSASLFKMLMSE
jgi:hypothetical protein